ncbi:MAG: acyltransferase family protein [Steroidobacteraceae bacterium]
MLKKFSENQHIKQACSYDIYKNTNNFSSLNGLRCFAIIAVIWAHTGIHIDSLHTFQKGHLGVDLFFAISGYLITTLLLREHEQHGQLSLTAFYLRRSLRIFPLYYTVILIYVFAVYHFESSSSAGRDFFTNLPYFLTYTSNWFVPLEGRVIFYFAWSLATEEQFYLLWPTVEKFLRGWRVVGFAVAVLIIREMTRFAVLTDQIARDHLAVTIILSIHPAILGGVILAHLMHNRNTFNLVKPILGANWSSPLLLASLFAAIEFSLPSGFVWALMVALVGSVVIRESNGLSYVLRWQPISFIGLISYGMYLLHMLSFHFAKRILLAIGIDQDWFWFPATIIVATLVASISYYYYESIFLRIKNRYSRIKPKHGAVST